MNSVWGGYRGTVMVLMLYTMQSKVDWFLTRGKNVLLFSDSTVLIINIIFTLKEIKTPKKNNAITAWQNNEISTLVSYTYTLQVLSFLTLYSRTNCIKK